MEVEYVQTPKDHVAFNLYHQACQPWWRRHLSWWVGCLFFPVLMMALKPWLSMSGRSVIFCSVFCIALWTAHALGDWRRGTANRVRKWVRRHKKDLLGWRRCNIQPEGVTIVTEDSSSTFKWTGIVNIGQTAEHAFFYRTTTAAIIVPRQPFATEQDFQAFVETARRYRDAARESPHKELPPPGEPDTNITADKRADR